MSVVNSSDRSLDLGAIGSAARDASRGLGQLSTTKKNEVLAAIAAALRTQTETILKANVLDVEAAKAQDLDLAVIDRLTLNRERLDGIAAAVDMVEALPDPVGAVDDARRLPNGLEIGRRRVPLGVVAVIFEARPNVTVDISALCLKAGNAVILRGGREALQSNIALANVIRAAIEAAGAPSASVQLIDDPDRSLLEELLRDRTHVDVVVPRGGSGLIDFVSSTATVPVIETGWGVCHTFVDAGADLAMAERIVLNAKTRRPSICNALDTLLVHRDVAEVFLPSVGRTLVEAGVELHADGRVSSVLGPEIPSVVLGDDDLDTEWLALRMSVVVVDDFEHALAHIQEHGSGHSEAIVTSSHRHARRFVNEVDAAAVYVNASTQFTDGGEFGLGAEVGISTQKLHARGPMGLREMTTYKWIVQGDGQVRPV
ncbi:MAG: glutamate-5-semialdehyde dehydrogenase [Chloroflexi bacterium]|nr:glutamate-5-semialdehyde dehydrogenase [Chloroflexota bacterium]HCU73415.1 glutamate-5-semialdehyde dehydrogenase [Chloroflexota bacterium]|tara:strand:- start:1227 stop:2513 length:1287 start_codon:yes stop_codon:yes gene_type:complete